MTIVIPHNIKAEIAMKAVAYPHRIYCQEHKINYRQCAMQFISVKDYIRFFSTYICDEYLGAEFIMLTTGSQVKTLINV